jgi:hypothetical protein
MKRIEVLILDDNFVIARKIKERLFKANVIYKHASGIEIFPYYLEVDNQNAECYIMCEMAEKNKQRESRGISGKRRDNE